MSPPGRPKGEYRRAQPEGTPVSAQTVFVVDDDDAYRDSIVELVASVGLRAECFASAQQFLDAFDPQRGGCLVLDVRMAHMSGIALQARLKAMAATLPIVFVSGHGDIEMAVKAVKDGAVDFVQKPYREQQLLDAINEALRHDAETRRCAARARARGAGVGAAGPAEQGDRAPAGPELPHDRAPPQPPAGQARRRVGDGAAEDLPGARAARGCAEAAGLIRHCVRSPRSP